LKCLGSLSISIQKMAEKKRRYEVVIYARVSTADQNVKQQVKYLREWCAKQGYQVYGSIADTESGRLPLTERKQFRKLLANPKADAIVVHKLDRLTRNWDDVTLIERHFRTHWNTCKLISAGDPVDLSNAAGRFNFRVLMALNCYMPEDLVERQKVGIDRARRQGKYRGRKPGAKNK